MDQLIFPKDEAKARSMAAYMKHLFPFSGINAPVRKQLTRPYLKASRTLSADELFALVTTYYQKEEREYQYFAIDLAVAHAARLSYTELLRYQPLVSEKAWWDSVDAWCKLFSVWSLHHMDAFPELFAHFDQQPDFWQRRIALTMQLPFKEKTNPLLLEKAILFDQYTDEFFIQKAIGWALRQYSKTNPAWVQTFMNTHTLSSLAKREGGKYL